MRAALGQVLGRGRRLLAGYERRFAALGAVAVVAGLLEAVVLVVVVPLVQGIADERHLITLAVPGVDQAVHLRTLFAVGLAAVAARLVVQLLLARQRARLLSSWDAALRRRVFHAYLGADWSVQSSQRATHVQETLTGHLGGAQLILGALTSGWIAIFSLGVMLAAAVVVNLAGAVLIIAFGIAMSLALRPLARRSRAAASELADNNLRYVQEIGDAAGLAREVRVFGTAEATRGRFDDRVATIAALRRRTVVLGSAVPAIYQNVVILVVLAGLALIYAFAPAQLTSLAVVVLVLIRASAYGQTVQVSYQQLNEAGPFFEKVVGAEALFLAHPQRSGTEAVVPIDEVRFEGV